MRIGFDGKRATHNFRGLGVYSRSLIEGIIDNHPEHQLFLYTPPYNDSRAIDWVNKYKNQLHIRTPNNLVSEGVSGLWRSYFLDRRAKADKLDIFHGLSHELPFFLKKNTTKWVVTIHDLIFLRYPEFFPFLDRQVYLQKFTRASQSADLVIAICEQTKQDLIEMLKIDEKKIIVHHQSCDPQFYHEAGLGLNEHVRSTYSLPLKYILHVGAFEERKNQLNTIEAFNKIANQVPHDLVFVGMGKKYLDKAQKLASDLGLENRIRFLTNVSFIDLPSIYQMADLFCFPSIFEGFGIPIIEALFSKTPVLTSTGSCFPESAGPHSYFVDPLSIDEIANGILSILSNPKLQETMIEEGWIYAQQFRREETTKKLIEIYQKI